MLKFIKNEMFVKLYIESYLSTSLNAANYMNRNNFEKFDWFIT